MVVAATGFFDGVHLGHKYVLDEVVRRANELGVTSSIITFWPHPRTVLRQDAVKFRLLTTLDEKIKLIKSYGIDNVHVLEFDKSFSNQTTKEFFSNYLIGKFGVKELIVGFDHRVGNDINQTQNEMLAIANSLGIETKLLDQFTHSQGRVSSTKIRESLLFGDLHKATTLLGYRYGLEGVVVEGRRLGRTLGFPTANIKLYEPLKVLPSDGVYFVWAECEGKVFAGLTNIGTRPTIGADNERTIETYLLDFDEEIYGLNLKIELVEKLRDEVAFGTLDDLIIQMNKDKAKAKELDFPGNKPLILR